MLELVALSPLALFVILLVGLRQSAAMAGMWSAGLCAGLAIAAFDYPITAPSVLGPLAEAMFISATIVWIIFPALGIYELQQQTGATQAIGQWLASISAKPQVQALLIAWFFGLFLEGAAGFGTPIALVAPMLVALGFPPVKSLVMALFGHAAGVSFGAVGTPIVPLAQAAPLDTGVLSLLILVPHAVLAAALVLIVFCLARPADPAEVAPRWLIPLATLCFIAPAAALAWFAGPELPTLGGAVIGVALFILAVRSRRSPGEDSASGSAGALALAGMPYLIVLALILLTRLIEPIGQALQGTVLSWRIGLEYTGSIAPLHHPGTVLMLALLASGLVTTERRGALLPALRRAGIRLPPVALALVSVLILARVMVHSGMIDTLARGVSDLLGEFWPIASPLVAALGSFVTGSATTSNIILAEFQVAAALAVGIAPLVPLAGQGFGSAIGNIVAPHNIVAGAATVGVVGREGEVLKQTLPVCACYAVLGGVILFIIERIA